MTLKLALLLIALMSGLATIPALIILLYWQQEDQNEELMRRMKRNK